MSPIVVETNLPYPLYKRGKVRDVYRFGEDKLLIVATDRISAFDHVLPTPIPHKGEILTQLTIFWFNFLEDVMPNHHVKVELRSLPPEYRLRTMLVKKAVPIPVEFIVRGYLTGAAWNEYVQTGTVWGMKLASGLREADKLERPIFTPTLKATVGHDEPISFATLAEMIGWENAEYLRDKSIEIYEKAHQYAYERGIIIADMKLEFGWINGELAIIDEVLTPDSSRFWARDEYEPGKPQVSFDKQFVRDYLTTVWDKNSAPPELPEEIVKQTYQKYVEAYNRLTGRDFNKIVSQ